MLPRKFRLTKSTDITATIRRGKLLATPYVNIHYLSTVRPYTRIACVVGKKVSSSAVRRHKYQRWLRACARGVTSKPSAYDMVWIAGPKIAQLAKQAELQQKLQPHLSKLW